MRFNPAPGWPTPPPGWTPLAGWTPDPSWASAPDGWQFWVDDEAAGTEPRDARAAAEQVSGTDQAMQPVGASASGAEKPPISDMLGERDRAASGRHAASDSADLATVAALRARVAELEHALVAAQTATADLVELSDQRVLQDVGIYRYHHPLEDAAAYKDRLAALEDQIRDRVKAARAILAADMFTFDGLLAKGRRLVGDLSRLMLRAYNAEADSCVRSLRSGNVTTATKRLESAVAAIERLGSIMEMRIDPDYHARCGWRSWNSPATTRSRCKRSANAPAPSASCCASNAAPNVNSQRSGNG